MEDQLPGCIRPCCRKLGDCSFLLTAGCGCSCCVNLSLRHGSCYPTGSGCSCHDCNLQHTKKGNYREKKKHHSFGKEKTNFLKSQYFLKADCLDLFVVMSTNKTKPASWVNKKGLFKLL